MKKGKVSEFIGYLIDQVGQPYVWGGQHLKLTPADYEQKISKRESDPAYRSAAVDYCREKIEGGASVLYAYDCSGLGMYWLQNVKKIFAHDMSANGMLNTCEITERPKRGYWVFRMNGDRASHVGYMISDADVIHAKGRAYGVVREPYRSSYWHVIGIPACMEFDDPEQPQEQTHQYVHVLGGSVRVRAGNGTMFPTIGTAHRGDLLPCFGQEDRDPYWYCVDFKGQQGFISSNTRYTEVVYRAGR